MKTYIQIVSFIIVVVLVFGVAAPMLISHDSYEGPIAGVLLVLLFGGVVVKLIKNFFNPEKKR